MSAGFETGDMSIVTTDDKTCITVNEGFQTSALTDSEGGGDIFIGFGNTLGLGLYERLRINDSTCQVIQDMGLIYAPCEETIQSSILASVSFIDVTSTEDLTRNLPRVSVFPNPASQTVTLDFELMQSATVNVEIYDLVGKIHKVSIQEQLTAGRQLKTVDVSQLPVGVYMLRIQTSPSDFIAKKLVISQ